MPLPYGTGERLFAPGARADFRFGAVEPVEAGAFTVLRRDR
ncbi:hypothetical protein ACLQ25_08280 [Micromonospora sp. DT44]